jgi:hypothetical protein
MIRLAAIILALCITSAALAQVPPYTYPLTIGTSSVTVLPANPARKKVVFHNPNDTAKIAVCPNRSEPRRWIIAIADRRGHQWHRLHYAVALPDAGDQRQHGERPAAGDGFGLGRHRQRARLKPDNLGI